MARIKILFLLLPAFVRAEPLIPAQEQTLSAYISERNQARLSGATQVMNEAFERRLQGVEEKVLPISILVQRAIKELNSKSESVEKLLADVKGGKTAVDPYKDAGWLASTREETKDLCCKIKGNPNLQRRIQAGLGLTPDVSDPSATSQGGTGRFYRRLGPRPGGGQGAGAGPGRGAAGFRRFRGGGGQGGGYPGGGGGAQPQPQPEGSN